MFLYFIKATTGISKHTAYKVEIFLVHHNMVVIQVTVAIKVNPSLLQPPKTILN